MIIEKKKIYLNDGRELILRSPVPQDAAALLKHKKITSEETYYMARYPEEINMTVEKQAEQLNAICLDEDCFMIAAYFEGNMIANASVQRIGNHIKYRHRAGFGISVQKAYWNSGLGKCMLKEVIDCAAKTIFAQLELGVFRENFRAIHLYEKCGFVQWGMLPRAFRLKDGAYRDEIQMIYYLKV